MNSRPGSPAPPAAVWRFAGRTYDLALRPCVMGILNVTPDSFSDGNRYGSVAAAVAAARQMVDEGADIIDVGGESTRPDAATVSADEEIRRVVPVIEKLAGLAVPISIDTWKAPVAAAALQAGAAIVNDISAMTFDPRMVEVVADSAAGLVLMHTRGAPTAMQKDTVYTDLVAEIAAFLHNALSRAVTAGIDAERIVVDPGIGFGKSVSGNLEILRRLPELATLHRPLLIGPSRKSFIGAVLGREVADRLFGTVASVAVAMLNGAAIFRVHDVRATRDTVDMVRAITSPG